MLPACPVEPLAEISLMKSHLMTLLLTALPVLMISATRAHDTWVETNTNIIRTGDAVYVDLKLGNHGNDHRDFKLASKIRLESCTLEVIAPDGTPYDVRGGLADVGYAPNEGYWTTKFVAARPGLYLVSHRQEQVVSYAPVRVVRSGKACFVVSDSLDRVPLENPGFDRALGHALELVPAANPVTPMGPGEMLRVKLLYKGRPLPQTRVSFVPRGVILDEEIDAEHDRTTDADGLVEFTPKTGNVYLIVAHHLDPDEAGEGYESTKYSATLTVFVPEVCPCCLE
jgi:uncharacterized GH25 family protein